MENLRLFPLLQLAFGQDEDDDDGIQKREFDEDLVDHVRRIEFDKLLEHFIIRLERKRSQVAHEACTIPK